MAVFTVIDHTEVGAAGVASWEVTGISASYDHLYIVASARHNQAGYLDSMLFQLNSDSGTDYTQTRLGTNGSTFSNRSATQITAELPADSVTANTFGTFSAWIPNYANTSHFKPVLIQGAVEGATTALNTFQVYVVAGLYSSTAAVSAVKLVGQGSDVFVQYSTFTLYGVTGA